MQRVLSALLPFTKMHPNPRTSMVFPMLVSGSLREWLFVGESNNTRAHLLEHHYHSGKAKSDGPHLRVVFSPSERSTRRNALARELSPAVAALSFAEALKFTPQKRI
jgi:hypothetical protein